jgi:2-amino-4-hydroxy-6-hydroxymethyldihydropteridine diphosphokinase
MEPRDVYVGLGSNVEPLSNVPRMLDSLLRLVPVVDVSPIAVTDPVNMEGAGQPFLNAAVRLRTELAEQDVKEYFNAVEVALGRDRTDPRRSTRDRPADLDILFTLAIDTPAIPESISLPSEVYLRPQLDALLAYVGLPVAAPPRPSDASGALHTVTLDFHGVMIGSDCATLRRSHPAPEESS